MGDGELAAMAVLIGIVGAGLHHLLQQPHALGDLAEMDFGDAQHALGRE